MIGDFERFLGSLYPYRYVIAAGVAVLVVLILVIGYRRRWHDAIRRHPRVSLGVLAVMLAIGIPAGSFLAGPLFTRTQLVEDAPVAGGGAATFAPTGAATPEPPGGAATVARGEFQGADEFHFGRGTALLLDQGGGNHTLRFEEFSVQNGPDLFVYLSTDPDGYSEDGLELGPLKATDGSFNYSIPAGTDISRYRSAVVWCRQFAVLFARATLGPAEDA